MLGCRGICYDEILHNVTLCMCLIDQLYQQIKFNLKYNTRCTNTEQLLSENPLPHFSSVFFVTQGEQKLGFVHTNKSLNGLFLINNVTK